VAEAGIDERGPAGQVLGHVAHRLAHRFADEGERGEVEHRLVGAEGEGALERVGVGHRAAHHQRPLRHGSVMARREVVEHRHGSATAQECEHEVAADEPGTAGDQEPSHHPELSPVVRLLGRVLRGPGQRRTTMPRRRRAAWVRRSVGHRSGTVPAGGVRGNRGARVQGDLPAGWAAVPAARCHIGA
jgi:hypothetical protein